MGGTQRPRGHSAVSAREKRSEHRWASGAGAVRRDNKAELTRSSMLRPIPYFAVALALLAARPAQPQGPAGRRPFNQTVLHDIAPSVAFLVDKLLAEKRDV